MQPGIQGMRTRYIPGIFTQTRPLFVSTTPCLDSRWLEKRAFYTDFNRNARSFFVIVKARQGGDLVQCRGSFRRLGKLLKTKILFCGLSLCVEGTIAGFQS